MKNAWFYTNLTAATIPYNITRGGVTYNVVSVSDNTFQNCAKLKSVELSSSVTMIGNLAFDGCANLAVSPVSSSIETIGDYAFRGCSSIKSVAFDGWFETLGVGAFSGCSSLESVTFPGGRLYDLTERAFEGCTSLKLFIIPSHIKTIGSCLLDGCTSLTLIECQGSEPAAIATDAFDGTSCPILVPAEAKDAYVKSWPQYADRITSEENKDILIYEYNVTELTAKVIGFREGITEKDKETVTIPRTVTKGGMEFSVSGWSDGFCNNTWNVKHLIINASWVKFPSAMIHFGQLESIVLPDCLEELSDILYGSAITTISLPGSLRVIGAFAFNGTQLKSVTIPSGVTAIQDFAFARCSSLSAVNVRAKTPPVLIGEGQFDDTNNCPIIVPHASLDQYLAAEGWKIYADRIVPDIDTTKDFPITDEDLEIAVGTEHKLRIADWESSDPTVATVDQDGNIRAVDTGETLITATLLDGSGRTGCFVRVVSKAPAGIEKATFESDNSEITGVYDVNGIKLLGSGADINDLHSLPSGVYIVTTRQDTYKIKL